MSPFLPDPRARRRAAPAPPSAGFTLIELVAVMVLVGVLAAVALPRWQGADTTLDYQADRLARDLRHAQALAMSWGQALRFSAAGAGYSVACKTVSGSAPCDGAGPVTDPASGEAFAITLGDASVSGPVIDFDSLGRPRDAGGLIGAAASFSVSSAGNAATVSVEPLTGAVSTAY